MTKFKKIFILFKLDRKGLSLIEILVYVTLLSVVLGLTTNFLYQTANFKVNQQLKKHLFENSQLIIDKIRQDLKDVQTVNTPSDENFVSELNLETSAGSVVYNQDNTSLKRNGTELTDDRVEFDIGSVDTGFRRIGNSIQLKFLLKTKQKPFGREQKEETYTTTIYFMED